MEQNTRNQYIVKESGVSSNVGLFLWYTYIFLHI